MTTTPLHRSDAKTIWIGAAHYTQRRNWEWQRKNEGERERARLAEEKSEPNRHAYAHVYFKTMSQQNYFALHFCNIST